MSAAAQGGAAPDLPAFLAGAEVFAGLDEDARRLLAEHLEVLAVEGGQVVMAEGDAADGLYLVASGRLQARIERDGASVPIGEVGRGEVVGEAALLTDRPRSATVVALRDSVLYRLPVDAFEEVLARSPLVLRPIAGQVVERLRRASAGEGAGHPVSTVALVPIHEGQACADAVDALASALRELIGRVAEVVEGDEPGDGAGGAWLDRLEEEHDLVVLRAGGPEAWTQRCLRQSDQIVLVADADRPPTATPVEALVTEHRSRVDPRVELVLTHPEGRDVPRGTARWLRPRDIDRHHHIRRDRPADAARVARLLTNRGFGLVLSGGGARGMAEIGVVAAMERLGIPIDAIGGTSAGSLVAGAVARGWPADGVARTLRRGMVTDSKPVDLTLPVSSLAAGRRITERLRGAAGETDIEDLWIDYYCVSTNLTRMRPMVHRSGLGWRAIRASMSIPGVFPPVAHDGDVLVDGGLVDNLPVAEMRRGHDGITVIAVDVGVQRGMTAGDLPESTVVDGWRLLLDRLHPVRRTPEVVGMLSLLTRLTELGGGASDDRDPGDVTVRPDVGGFPILDFERFDELVEVGRRDGRAVLEPWWQDRAGSG